MDTSNLTARQENTEEPWGAEFSVEQMGTTGFEDWDFASIQREIEAAEWHHERIAHGLVHLPDGKVQITEEWDLLHGIKHTEKTVKRMVSGMGPATKRVKAPFAPDHLSYVLTPLGEAIWTMCRTMVPLIERMYPGCRKPARLARELSVPDGMRPVFNPRITVTLHACQIALPILSKHAGAFLDLEQPVVRRVLDHLLRTVRKICRSRRFKYRENNYKRNANLRFKGACKYIADLFDQNSKPLILRVDLYFSPDHKEWADTNAAGRSINAFMRALREGRVVPDMLGSALRLQNAFRRGIHVHLLVVMDGHLHREAATWSRIIGETWVNKYSRGHGTYFNCYTRKDWFKFNGLGLVHFTDVRKLMGIREALRYMTKPDFQIATGFTRNFRKGQPSRMNGAVKRGAPRKGDQGTSLVDVILRHV